MLWQIMNTANTMDYQDQVKKGISELTEYNNQADLCKFYLLFTVPTYHKNKIDTVLI